MPLENWPKSQMLGRSYNNLSSQVRIMKYCLGWVCVMIFILQKSRNSKLSSFQKLGKIQNGYIKIQFHIETGGSDFTYTKDRNYHRIPTT